VGSNIDPSENIVGALEQLTQAPGVALTGISTFYRTPALPPPGADPRSVGHDPDYLNGVLTLDTTLDRTALSRTLEGVEAVLGRIRTDEKFAPRTMDLDLLLFLSPRTSGASPPPGDPPIHPEVRSRPFVAIPLLELAPDLLLPPDGIPLKEVAASFSGPGGEPEAAFTASLRARFLPS
jgi:2-amino-4-hydroxy-6-hydroxymethyldihydropteridine diphosphokinase